MPDLSDEFQHAGERAARDLHAVMACGLVPILLLPLSWWLTLRRVIAGDTGRLRSRLIAVTAFDTLLAVMLGVVLLTQGLPDPEATDPPRIGIQIDADPGVAGARVASVWQDSPAHRAGLRKGDIVESIDGTRIASWEGLSAELRLRKSGEVRRLRVRRDDRVITLDVTPVSGLAANPAPRPVFEVQQGQSCGRDWLTALPQTLWPVGVGCLIIAALAAWGRWGRRRDERSGPGPDVRWAWVLLPLLLAPPIGIAGAYGACTATGGWSTGAALLGLIAQGLGMLGIGYAVLRALRTQLDARMGPRLSTARAARLAVLYIASAMARATIALYVLMTLVPSLQAARDPGVSALIEGTSSPLGRLLMITAAVVLAPLAEEVVFRGILLPGLSRHMRTQNALLISAALFGLFHVPSHGIGAIMPGLLGLVFGWARLRTGSLAAPILLHAANNLLVTLLAWGV